MKVIIFCQILCFLCFKIDLVISISMPGPSFLNEPPDHVIYTNNTGTHIKCLAKGDPPPTITWIGLDHAPVRDIPGVREVWSNGTLNIHPFSGSHYRQDAHAGTYQCKASNAVGTILAPSTTLRGVVVQDLEIRLYDEYVITGNTAVLRCIIPNFLDDLVKVTAWERDDSFHIYPSNHGDGKHHALPDGRLLVHSAEPADSYATFRCRAKHKITSVQADSNTARIIVNDPRERSAPQIVTQAETVVLKEEEAVILPCIGHAHPPPKYRWFVYQHGRDRRPLQMSISRLSFIGQSIPQNKAVLYLSPQHEVLRYNSHVKIICEAYNDIGSTTMEVSLEKSTQLTVKINPTVATVDTGSTGRFVCLVSGGPSKPRKFQWFRDGRLLSPSADISITEGGSVLEVRGARRNDVGMYQCFVTVLKRTFQAVAELRLGASPPEFVYRFIQQTLMPGPAVSLKCIARGSPTPTISWNLDGFPLPQSERILVGQYVNSGGEVVSHVNISRTRVEDGGKFNCIAVNEAGEVSHGSPLFVYGSPYIREMGKITAVAGESFRVRCPVAGYPFPVVSWTKGGREIPLSRRYDVSGAELHITKVSRGTDEGQYVCTVSDKQGRTTSKTLNLKVVEPPRLDRFSLPDALAAGSRLAVHCVIKRGDPPIRLEWSHNGRSAQLVPGLSVTPLGQFVLALVIDQLDPEHAGNYTCRATSEATSTSDVHSAMLQVHVAPHWIEEPNNVDIIVGEKAVLNCIADGFPKPVINWRRTRKGVKKRMFHSMGAEAKVGETLRNGSYLITDVSEDSEGLYVCEVSNGVGTDLSATVTLDVHVPPKVHGQEVIQARRGEFASIKCNATGDPPLTLSVSRNGHPIDPMDLRYSFRMEDRRSTLGNSLHGNNLIKKGSSIKQAELRLTSVNSQDSGDFICTATNPFGSDSLITKLDVQDVPNAPRDLRLADEESRSVAISWAPPSVVRSPITYYLIHVKTHDELWDHLKLPPIKINGGNTISSKVENLLPATSYKIRIVAVNDVGESPPSEALTVRTQGEEPSASPLNVEAMPLSSQTIRLSWSAPEKSSWHGKLLGYFVGYRKESSSEPENYTFQKVELTNGNPSSWIISNLGQYTRYIFVVQAFNSHGSGPLSKEVHASTHEDVPEAPPQDISCTALTSRRLEIAWTSPPKHLIHGIIKSYNLLYTSKSKFSVTDLEEKKILSGERTILGGLEPFTNYTISMSASTKAGKGRESKTIRCETEEDVPEPIKDFKVLIAGKERAIVAWKQPHRMNGPLTKYTLYIQSEHSQESKRKMVPPQTRWMEIGDLEENRKYFFWITASTQVGESSESRKKSATLSAKVPAGIMAVNERLRVAKGSDILLPCPFVGDPTPSLVWRRDEAPVESNNRWERQPDGGLFLRDTKVSHSGNYSCTATNQHGADQVTYSLIVMVPPEAPLLRVLSSTPDSIIVTWQVGDDGGSTINKLTLTWRPDREEWREINILRHATQYVFKNLSCGTVYHMYLTPHNKIGPGSASEMVSVKTKGDRPFIPVQHRVLVANVSSVQLKLEPFSDRHCPVEHYFIRIKPARSKQWLIASGRIAGSKKEYSTADLAPSSEYYMEVVATNQAGETQSRYTFRTLSLKGELLNEALGKPSEQDWMTADEYLLSDPAFIVPVILSCIAFVAIIVSAVICLKRRPSELPSKHACSEQERKLPLSRSIRNASPEDHYFPTIKKPPSSPHRDIVESSDTAPEFAEDIYPYATFQMKQQSDASTLQTLVFQDPRKPAVHTVAYRKDGLERMPTHGRSLSSSSEYAQVRRVRNRGIGHGIGYVGADSEDYEESACSDTDTDAAPSTRTGSSCRAEDQSHLSSRNTHHNMLYLTSDASTIPSPPSERKHFGRQTQSRAESDSQDRIYGISAIRNCQGFPSSLYDRSGQVKPSLPGHRSHPNPKRKGSSDALNYSEAECDREIRGRRSKGHAFFAV